MVNKKKFVLFGGIAGFIVANVIFFGTITFRTSFTLLEKYLILNAMFIFLGIVVGWAVFRSRHAREKLVKFHK